MAKKKLMRFAEMEILENVVQAEYDQVYQKDHPLKGKWKEKVFNNNKPLVIELGCGKGEYTIGLAQKYPGKNFLGMDIKGARIWRGATTARDLGLKNVAFLRARIEFISSFFCAGEVDEIWITFPDPQLKKRRAKKRLTSSRFLNNYRTFLSEDGIIHLKTDSKELYDYTNLLISYNSLHIFESTPDLYESEANEILSIRTFYENLFLEEGKKITYTKFQLTDKTIIEPPIDE